MDENDPHFGRRYPSEEYQKILDREQERNGSDPLMVIVFIGFALLVVTGGLAIGIGKCLTSNLTQSQGVTNGE